MLHGTVVVGRGFVDGGAIYLSDKIPDRLVNYYTAFSNNAFMGAVFYGVYTVASWIGSDGHTLFILIICLLTQVAVYLVWRLAKYLTNLIGWQSSLG